MMPIFHGRARKLALVPLHLFLLGWLAYVVGFVWSMVDNEAVKRGPEYYDDYSTAVGGVILYLLSMLHTGLPELPSKIVGSITAILGVIYFVPASFKLYDDGKEIYDKKSAADIYEVCIFVGILVTAFCWTLVQMFSLFYKYKGQNPDMYVRLYDDNTDQMSSYSLSSVFAGIARKLVVPLIVLSAIGWCVYIAGVHDMPQDLYNIFPYDINYWGANLIAVLLFMAALLHAGCSGGASKVMGVSTALLSMVFLVFMGSVVYKQGDDIYKYCKEEFNNCSILHSSVPKYSLYQFGGGIGCCFFWAFVLALWPFYKQIDIHTHSGHVQRPTLTTSYRQEDSYNEDLPLLNRQ